MELIGYLKIVLTVLIIFFTYILINIKETSVVTYNPYTSVMDPIEHKARYSEKDTHRNNWRWMNTSTTCEPRKFVFLKVHKAGSSTLRKLLHLYATDNNFEMTLSRLGPWVGGYPGIFNDKFHQHDSLTEVIYDHLRWNETAIFKTLTYPRNHVKIAIVRDPNDAFKSSFNYFYGRYEGADGLASMREKRQSPVSQCIGEPYFSAAGHTDMTMTEYVHKIRSEPELLYQAPWYFRANNSQAFDFNYAENLDDFDLVMVLERMQESLVLLKHLLCASWSQIVPFNTKLNSKEYEIADNWIEKEDEDFLNNELLNYDHRLYKQALDKLEKMIAHFGKDEMEHAIRKEFANEQKRKKGKPHRNNFSDDQIEKVLSYMSQSSGTCEAYI